MTKDLSLALFITLCAFWISCTDGDETQSDLPSNLENGVFILNEGGFGSANASLSFLDNLSGQVYNDVFFKSTGEDLGDVLQSGFLYENELYLVMNGSGLIRKLTLGNTLNEEELLGIGKLGDAIIQQPRYLIRSGNDIFYTEWIDFGSQGRMTAIDVSGEFYHSVVFEMGVQPEGLILINEKLFVANSGSGNLFVIDPKLNTITDTITVGSSPSSFVKDAEGDIWVICAGGYDESFSPLNDGKLVEINPSTLEIKSEIVLKMNVAGQIGINPAGDMLYYFSGTSLYTLSTTATEAPESGLIVESSALGFYGMGVAPDGTIYLADAKDYASAGEVFRYNEDGSFIDKFTVGIIPNGFVFNQ